MVPTKGGVFDNTMGYIRYINSYLKFENCV